LCLAENDLLRLKHIPTRPIQLSVECFHTIRPRDQRETNADENPTETLHENNSLLLRQIERRQQLVDAVDEMVKAQE